MGQVMPMAKAPREVDVHFQRGPKLEDVAQDDVVGRMLAIEQRIRDGALYEEKTRIVREALSHCVKLYHVNHQYKCRPIAIEYLKMIQHKNMRIERSPLTIPAEPPASESA